MKNKTQGAERSEATHTPGPWYVLMGHYNNGTELKIVPADNQISTYIMVGGEDNIANAHLIAAAPELLTALIACSEGLECVANSEGEDGCNHCLAGAAISKAEGR